jgi:hypothetical protein
VQVQVQVRVPAHVQLPVYGLLFLCGKALRALVRNDAKTVNVISTACFSDHPKILVAALQFFIGEKDLAEQEEEEEEKAREDCAIVAVQ